MQSLGVFTASICVDDFSKFKAVQRVKVKVLCILTVVAYDSPNTILSLLLNSCFPVLTLLADAMFKSSATVLHMCVVSLYRIDFCDDTVIDRP